MYNYNQKVRSDSSQFLLNKRKKIDRILKKRVKSEEEIAMSEAFDSLYSYAAVKYCDRPAAMRMYIETELYEDYDFTSEWLDDKLKQKQKLLWLRRRRVYWKSFLANFNYFVTFTYDDEKMTESEFRDDIKRCLSNLASRRGWVYAGLWERGGESDRLHLHVLIRIPEGQDIGYYYYSTDYDTRKRKMVTIRRNTFFDERFGRNDFAPINTVVRGRSPVGYVIKYLEKSEDNVLYSHHLPTFLGTEVSDDEVADEMIIKKQSDNGILEPMYSRYILHDLLDFNPLYGWFRVDNRGAVPLSG